METLHLVASPPYAAVRAFFVELLTAPKLPPYAETPTAQIVKLIGTYHAQLLTEPTINALPALRQAAIAQGMMVNQLWHRHAQPLYQHTHPPTLALSMLYAGMIDRISQNAHRDPSFNPRAAANGLGKHIDPMLAALSLPLTSVADYHSHLHETLDYLVYLAFTFERLN
jgi:hypothetical protein